MRSFCKIGRDIRNLPRDLDFQARDLLFYIRPCPRQSVAGADVLLSTL